jgi:hypothetical protein
LGKAAACWRLYSCRKADNRLGSKNCGWHQKIKRRAAIQFGFSPDLSAMAADHSLHQCQTDASAIELGFTMHSLKGSEQLVDIDQSNPTPLSRTKKMVESASSMQPTSISASVAKPVLPKARFSLNDRFSG